jgi:aminoglycoside 3-N-acetyltransferase|tara:strand:+ start:667 stop:1458 length:792 start_codon:yes stop_codon:yes gene_type:complete
MLSSNKKLSDFLNNYFSTANIIKGDKLLLHSNIIKLIINMKKEKFNFEISDIIDFLTSYLGEKGTLIIPTFNFDFCKGKTYSSISTKSQMGVLSETARKMAKMNKTWHPVYSFVLFGNIPTEELKRKNYSAFGKESIFYWLDKNDGKIAVIDLPDQKSMTYYHHVEEMENANWRFMKTFSGKYVNFKKEINDVDVKIFVRNLELGIITKVDGMEKVLWSKGHYKGHFESSYNGCRSIQVKLLKKEVKDIIRGNKAKGLLYSIK